MKPQHRPPHLRHLSPARLPAPVLRPPPAIAAHDPPISRRRVQVSHQLSLLVAADEVRDVVHALTHHNQRLSKGETDSARARASQTDRAGTGCRGRAGTACCPWRDPRLHDVLSDRCEVIVRCAVLRFTRLCERSAGWKYCCIFAAADPRIGLRPPQSLLYQNRSQIDRHHRGRKGTLASVALSNRPRLVPHWT